MEDINQVTAAPQNKKRPGTAGIPKGRSLYSDDCHNRGSTEFPANAGT